MLVAYTSPLKIPIGQLTFLKHSYCKPHVGNFTKNTLNPSTALIKQNQSCERLCVKTAHSTAWISRDRTTKPFNPSDSPHVKVQRKQTGFKHKAVLESPSPGGPETSNPC